MLFFVTWWWLCLCRNLLQVVTPDLFWVTVTPASVTKDWLHRAHCLYVCRTPDVTCTGQGATDVCSLVGMRRGYSETPSRCPASHRTWQHFLQSLLQSCAVCWYSGQRVRSSSVSIMTKGRASQPKDLGSTLGGNNACFLSHSVQAGPLGCSVTNYSRFTA